MTSESRTPAGIIEAWISRLLETDQLDRFDDLHIDEIDPAYQSRAEWITGAVRCLQVATEVRRRAAYEVTICVGLGLRDDTGPEHSIPMSLEALQAEIDWSPPSLYGFVPGSEPWIVDQHICATEVSVSRSILAHYCKWYDAADRAHRRSVWLVEQGAAG